MLVITLAGAGAFSVSQALPVIYGTNLGAIVLRLFLSVGMTGKALRLVRMEDVFCVVSGTLMMILFYAEEAGIPLVQAFLLKVPGGPPTQLAMAFLLSNLLPALLLTPLLPACAALLDHIWPNDRVVAPDAPAFVSPQALVDPATALDLLQKELGRLLSTLNLESSGSSDPESHVSPIFIKLGASIENFCVRLVSETRLDTGQSVRLQRFRAWLHTIRHIGEAVGEFSDRLASMPQDAIPAAAGLRAWLASNLALASQATSTLDLADIQKFHDASRPHAPEVEELRKTFSAGLQTFPQATRLGLSALADDFDIAAWMIHRISKLESCSTAPHFMVGNMSAYGKNLTSSQVDTVVAYMVPLRPPGVPPAHTSSQPDHRPPME